MFYHTSHSSFRASQRHLSNEEIEYIKYFGSRIRNSGALFFYLRKRDLPVEDQHRDWANHLVGTALVMSKDGSSLLTVWRNRKNGLKNICKKRKSSRKSNYKYYF